MNRDFPLPPAGPFAKMLPLVIGGLMPILVAGILAFQAQDADMPWLALALTLLMLPLTGLAAAATVYGRNVRLHDGLLRVRRWPLPREFAVANIDLSASRVADLQFEPGLRPMLKLFGSSMPGLKSGWFLTRERKRAYLLSTTGRRFAVLPLRDGRLLLLGVERPEALLAALREQAGPRGRGNA